MIRITIDLNVEGDILTLDSAVHDKEGNKLASDIFRYDIKDKTALDFFTDLLNHTKARNYEHRENSLQQ